MLEQAAATQRFAAQLFVAVGLKITVFPVKFPVSREFALETGAISTASPARQSGIWRLYPRQRQKAPPMAGFCELVAGLRTSEFGHFRLGIADSLRPIFEIFPFSGDRGRRPGSIYTAWSNLQRNVVKFSALATGNWECRTYTATRTGRHQRLLLTAPDIKERPTYELPWSLVRLNGQL